MCQTSGNKVGTALPRDGCDITGEKIHERDEGLYELDDVSRTAIQNANDCTSGPSWQYAAVFRHGNCVRQRHQA